MMIRFDEDARKEYLEAIVFYSPAIAKAAQKARLHALIVRRPEFAFDGVTFLPKLNASTTP